VSATADIHEAIYNVLRVDATLAGLSLTSGSATVAVYNNEPANVLYPHVLMSKTTETPYNTFGGPTRGIGWKDIMRVHVYSRYRGDLEAIRIHQRIVALLNFQPLTVTGFSQVTVECEQMRVMVEQIDKITTRHLVGEFTVTVQA
jgi:hypothetical protein